MNTETAAAGFLDQPPGWFLVVLWLSFAYVVCRTVVVGLLRTASLQAWLMGRLHGVPAPLHVLFLENWRGHDAKKLVRCCILAQEAECPVSIRDMSRHLVAGGDPERAVTALLAAKHAGIEASLGELLDLDLGGEDPLATVQKRIQAARRSRRTGGSPDA